MSSIQLTRLLNMYYLIHFCKSDKRNVIGCWIHLISPSLIIFTVPGRSPRSHLSLMMLRKSSEH